MTRTMTTQQQEQFLDEWLHGADHDFAQVREITEARRRQAAIASVSANRGEARTMTVQQQQQDPFSANWNKWFAEMFARHIESALKEYSKKVKKQFDHIEKNI